MRKLNSLTMNRIKQEGYKAKSDGKCKCDNPYKCNEVKSNLWLAAFDNGDSNKYESLR